MGDRILVVGTYDTKSDELAYLAKVIRRQGGTALTMDVSVLGDPPFPTDFSKHQVIEAGGSKVLASASSVEKALRGGLKSGGNVKAAAEVGRRIAERAAA